MPLTSILYEFNGKPLSAKRLKEEILAPKCGDALSQTVLNSIRCQLFSLTASNIAKSILLYGKGENCCFEFHDYNLNLRIYCRFIDKICIANIIEL